MPRPRTALPFPRSGSPVQPSFSAIIERFEERLKLEARIEKGKSMLVFGDMGVGKTHLLRRMAARSDILYIRETISSRNLLLFLLQAARESRVSGLSIPRNLTSLSVCGLKGVVQRVLAAHKWVIFLDQLNGPSPALGHLIKELNYFDRTPIIFAARSPHMEHIGHLRALCSDRTEQLEIKNWPISIAMEFAHRRAAECGLSATNLDSALDTVVEMTNGNPGAIVAMVEMAKQARYRIDGQIKPHVLYLDYRLAGPLGPPLKPQQKLVGSSVTHDGSTRI